MFFGDKKPAGLIVALASKDEEKEPELTREEMLEECGKECLKAIESKDAKALARAFKDLWCCCEDEEAEEECPNCGGEHHCGPGCNK